MATAEAPRASTANSEPPAPVHSPRAVARGVSGTRYGDAAWLIACLTPAVAVYALFLLWPLVQVVWLSLQHWNGYGPETFIGGRNFADLAGDSVFGAALGHTLLWDAGAVGLLTPIGLGVALLVRQTRRRSLPLATLFFPALLPPTVAAAVWTLVYSPLAGLLNTVLHTLGLGRFAADWLGDPHLALAAVFVAWGWSVLGIGTLIFWSGLSTIGPAYLEIALMEGAGPWWRFRHVLLPAIRRTGVIALLINVALAGEVFDLVFVTTGGGPGYATMLLPLDMYGRAFGGHTGQGAAVACIQIVLGLLLAAVTLVPGGDGAQMAGEGAYDRDGVRSRHSGAALPFLLIPLAVILLPLGWLLVVALGGSGFGVGPAVGLDPRSWDWGSFSAVWSGGMSGAMGTSVLLAVSATAATVLIAAPAAFAVTRLRRVVRLPLLALLLIGLFQPTPVLIIPLFSLLRDAGLLDTAWGILLPEVARGLPFAVLLLWAFLAQLPGEILDAAQVDGAGMRQLMVRIALPLARPALYAAAIWSFVTSWNEYLLPTLVSQDGSLATVPTQLATFIGRYDTQYAMLAAGSLLAIAPALLIYLVLRRPAAAGLRRAKEGIR